MRSRLDVFSMLVVLAVAACGGSSTTTPGEQGSGPQAPTGLTATVGDGQVALSWTAVSGATGYAVYYATTAGAGKAGTRVAVASGPSQAVSGLTNDTPYYFVVTASNAGGESAPSTEVSATPAATGPFAQTDVQGTWRYSILSAGAHAGWSRGSLAVDASGTATVTSYLDESGATTAPAAFFPVLLVNPTGHVRDALSIAGAHYTGELAPTSRKLIVATAATGGTASIAILQKHDPTVTFSTADVAGWGSIGGARKFVYDQISTGASPEEWEFAAAQAGSTPDVQYATGNQGSVALPYLAPSNPTRPANKVTTLAATADGVVSETVKAGVAGVQPEFLVSGGFLSDDKTTIVAVGLMTNPGAPTSATGRFVLRVYSVTNASTTASTLDTTTADVRDLAGTYALRRLVTGSSPLTASGSLSIDVTGVATFASYADSTGSTAPPATIPFTMLPPSLEPLVTSSVSPSPVTQFWGVLTGGTADATLYGKLSYAKDLIVFTQSVAGASAITFALK